MRTSGRADVWTSSTDGDTWVQATDEAEWPVRRNHAAAVFGRDILVFGGDGGSGLLSDVTESARAHGYYSS